MHEQSFLWCWADWLVEIAVAIQFNFMGFYGKISKFRIRIIIPTFEQHLMLQQLNSIKQCYSISVTLD